MMTKLSRSLLTLVLSGLATPMFGQSLPTDTRGSWDISAEECRVPGTSLTQIDIGPGRIDTYGGNAIVRQVERTGPVTYVAADYLETEGVAELGERSRTYFRLTQRDGPDRLNLIRKDVHAVDLVRCNGEGDDMAAAGEDRVLPLPTGLWVLAGDDCENPANASWRTYDGRGVYGAQSRSCEIDAVRQDGRRYEIRQTCIATYDGSQSTYQDTISIQAPRRFGLVEDGETAMMDFNWCGPRLRP